VIAVGRRPSLIECGEELQGGRVRCRYRGCRRWCASWLGLAIHLRKGHGLAARGVRGRTWRGRNRER